MNLRASFHTAALFAWAEKARTHKSQRCFTLELKLISIALLIPRNNSMSVYALEQLVTKERKLTLLHSSKVNILNFILLRRQMRNINITSTLWVGHPRVVHSIFDSEYLDSTRNLWFSGIAHALEESSPAFSTQGKMQLYGKRSIKASVNWNKFYVELVSEFAKRVSTRKDMQGIRWSDFFWHLSGLKEANMAASGRQLLLFLLLQRRRNQKKKENRKFLVRIIYQERKEKG